MSQAAPTPSGVALIRDDLHALDVAAALARDFAREAALRDRERRLPHTELERFSASGLGAITVPREHGGAGVSVHTLTQVIALLAAADGSLGQIPQNHYYALQVLRTVGTPAQQQRLFTAALAGDRFGNALAEIGTRTAAERLTRLVETGDGLFIEGRKFYCTGALFAQRIPTAVIDDEGRQHLAIVAAGSPGLTRIDDWSGFGQRTTGSGSVVFDRVPVSRDDVLPFYQAFERPTAVGPFAQIIHAAIDTGLARGALDDAMAFIRSKSRPWIDAGVARAADDPLTLHVLGRLATRLEATETLLEIAAEAVDEARQTPTETTVARASLAVAEAKVLATEVSLACGSQLLELAGSRAVLAEHGLDRHWRNARTHTLHDPVRWKYHTLGNHALNGVLPARKGTI